MVEKPRRLSEEEYNSLSKAEKQVYDKQKEDWNNFLKEESKESRFERVAKPRLAVIFGQLENIKKMVESPNYAVNFNTLNSMCEILHDKINTIRDAYNPPKKADVSNQVNKIFQPTEQNENQD